MNDRQHDLNQLRQEYKKASSEDRRVIAETAHRIIKESGKIHAMREALIKAHRRGDVENIKDIHSFIERKKEYKNE